MAWIDTYLRLKGAVGQAGPTGSVGFRGQGLRHIADITSCEHASVSGLFDIIREEQPYTFTSLPAAVVSGSSVSIKNFVKDLAGNIYVTTSNGELAVKAYDSNLYLTLIPRIGSGPVSLNGLRPITLGSLAIDNDTNTLYIADESPSNPAIYKLVINDTNYDFSQLIPSLVNPYNFTQINGLAIAESYYSDRTTKTLYVLEALKLTSIELIISPYIDKTIYSYSPDSDNPYYNGRNVTAYTDTNNNTHIWITTVNHNVYQFIVRSDGTVVDGAFHIAGIGYPTGGDSGLNTDPLRTSLNSPSGITYQFSSDTLYFIDGTTLYRIPKYLTSPSTRRIIKFLLSDPTTGQISVISPTGPANIFNYGAQGSIINDTSGNLYIPFQSGSNPILRLTTWNVDILEPGQLPLDGDYVNWSKTSPDGLITSTTQWLYVTTNGNDVLSTFEKVGRWIRIQTTGTGAAVAGPIGAVSSSTGSIGHTGPSEIGPRGPAGPAQDYAPFGERGETGVAGPEGPAGPTGYMGEYGDTGPTGYDGYLGEEGPQGQSGARGVQGVRRANFYKDTPFPTTNFPTDGLPGDYYIKNDSQALYYYSEAIPDDTYYLNRVVNTSDYIGTYGTPSSFITGYPELILPDNSTAQNSYNTALTAYKTAVEGYYRATLEERTTDTFLSDSVTATRRDFEAARSFLNASRGSPRRFAGPTGGWTTVGSPFLYEFSLAPGSNRTAGGTDLTFDAQYAFVFINKTFIPELFVVAGNVNPIDSSPITYPLDTKLYITTMADFSQLLPGTQFQIIWLPKNKTINPIIPQNSVLGTYIGTSINQVVGSTPTQNNGYVLSAFFLNYYTTDITASHVKFDSNKVIPDGSPVNMLYAKNGFPIKGNNPDQFNWLMKSRYGGLIELQLQITAPDILSSRFALPLIAGTYAIINNIASETNTPFVVIDNNISLVHTIHHPTLTYSYLGSTINLTDTEEQTTPYAVTTDTIGNVYYTRNAPTAENKTLIIKLPKSSLGSDNYTYANASIIFGSGNATPTGTEDGRTAISTYAEQIYGLTTDAQGRIYYSDTKKHCIRRINLDGTVITVAGVFGTAGWNGVGQAVKLNRPRGIYYDSANDHLYVADTGNHRIVRYSYNTQISEPTFIIGGSANNRPGVQPSIETTLSNVLFCAPESIILDENGFLYVADTFNSAVWKIDLENETSSLFAGTWNYGGYDVGLTPTPPPQLSPWEIASIVLTVLTVLVAIAVVVFTAGAGAAAVGPAVGSALVRQAGFRILPGIARAAARPAARAALRRQTGFILRNYGRKIANDAVKPIVTGTIRNSGRIANVKPTLIQGRGVGANWANARNAENTLLAAGRFIRG